MIKKADRAMVVRILRIMLAMVFVFFTVSCGSLAVIMLINGEKYQSMASEQQLYDTLVAAPRGDIYDTNMELLATSDTAYTIYITPNSIKNIDKEETRKLVKTTIAAGLSEILEMEYETIYGYTEKETSYVTVKKRIDKTVADKVRTFISDNSDLSIAKHIGIDETTKRYYPNSSLASVVLGFVGEDNQGLAGLESYYNTTLTGVAGRVVAAKNAQGADMPFSYQVVEEAKKGGSLVLSIDSYIQHIAEKYLADAVEANKASDRGAAIVMNVNTGEILAMAVKGDFDPNDPFTLSNDAQALLEEEGSTVTKTELLNKQWRNKAVSDSYEPGSVFKIFTAAMALEENQTSITHTYNCGYSIYVAGQVYHCHKAGGHGIQSLKEAMVHSCNPVFITLGQLVGTSKFNKYFEAFGFTEKTGIDIAGEGTSVYHNSSKMGPTELASSSFGQTFKITPIQLITAASAAVNGGHLMQPYIVSKVLDSENNVIESTQPKAKRQVISKETSEKIREMLLSVVEDGGASNAKVAGYSIGGKTGTSEKVAEMNSSGEEGLYISSFIGFAPMEDPEIALLVLIDEPKGANYYGSAVAAPIGSEIFSDVLPYLGYEPKYSDEEVKEFAIAVPDVTGKTVAEAKNIISAKGLGVRVVGSGNEVLKQIPAAGQSLSKDSTVIIYTESGENTPANVLVPDFKNMTVSEVHLAATKAGVNVELSGNISNSSEGIKAYKQSVEAGTEVEQGSIVTVYFRDSGYVDMAPQ